MCAQKITELSEEAVIDLGEIGYGPCLILIGVEAVVGENKYMSMHVLEVYRLERNGVGPAAARRLVIDPNQNCLVGDSEVPMHQVYAKNLFGAVPDEERGKLLYK